VPQEAVMDGSVPGLPEGLRGDYHHARPDFTLTQDMAAYTEADHGTWRTL
jgi:phenylalanine-4-hydroxylase